MRSPSWAWVELVCLLISQRITNILCPNLHKYIAIISYFYIILNTKSKTFYLSNSTWAVISKKNVNIMVFRQRDVCPLQCSSAKNSNQTNYHNIKRYFPLSMLSAFCNFLHMCIYCLHLGSNSTLQYYWSKIVKHMALFVFTRIYCHMEGLNFISHHFISIYFNWCEAVIVLDCSIITSFKCDTFIISLF